MEDQKSLIEELRDGDDARAYAKTLEIVAASESSPAYYRYLDEFASLLGHGKSYVRTRGFMLCCSQARWDSEGRLQGILPAMMALLNDPKPTVVRQCLKAAEELVKSRPDLCDAVREGIAKVDLSRYRETMAPLIWKDMTELLESMDG